MAPMLFRPSDLFTQTRTANEEMDMITHGMSMVSYIYGCMLPRATCTLSLALRDSENLSNDV